MIYAPIDLKNFKKKYNFAVRGSFFSTNTSCFLVEGCTFLP